MNDMIDNMVLEAKLFIMRRSIKLYAYCVDM